MDNHHSRRPPGLHLITSSSPARPVSTSPSPYRPSHSPFRYVHFDSEKIDEKATTAPRHDQSNGIPGPSHHHNHHHHRHHHLYSQCTSDAPASANPFSAHPSYILSQPSPLLIHTVLPPTTSERTCNFYTARKRLCNLLRPWLPILCYAATSLGFLIAIAFYKSQVFARLDELSTWLKTDKYFGYAVLFCLIFITTFPPLPMYSTLIILSGYTFGPWIGAVISYAAALTGALTVFTLSRHNAYLHAHIATWLQSTCSLKRVVQAIEKRPKLLFLIRVAPYPYNVMNCLLGAAAPGVSLRTFTVCTALSLFKVIVHTSLGASIHSFKDYHAPAPTINTASFNSTSIDSTSTISSSAPAQEEEENGAGTVARMWTILGITLCIVIFVYLSWCARKAVNEELGEEEAEEEERVAFLEGERDVEMGLDLDMSERAHHVPLPLSPVPESES
ncbi:cytoplasm protein [Moniliophthora roreri MCA 2997]|uniref:Golgi apparatus membrane protein TVP38 n=2 Tax=Moniliophthora roreri TaxID=221103 RepID=V2XYI7_MONRO|nr:cytoplasm protein [Moniliophthora roreri MCA 2997]KAI3612483.1 cytoplasm protein [Moniliophthora roreri]